ncbi:MAG: hypothetical protein ACREHD_17180 [Pirellulales bacterium]
MATAVKVNQKRKDGHGERDRFPSVPSPELQISGIGPLNYANAHRFQFSLRAIFYC